VTGEREPQGDSQEAQNEPTGLMRWLPIGKGHSARIRANEYKREFRQAEEELIYLGQALAECGQFEATLSEVVKLYKAYLVAMVEHHRERARWRELPKEVRPRSKKTALNQPARWNDLRAVYDQAQGLIEAMKAEGFDPIKWAQANPGPVGSQRTLGGSDGLTYIRRAPGEQ
jgi:hypothetical protein